MIIPRLRVLAACALAAAAACAAYRGTLDNGFTWDDHIHIEAAPFVQDAHNARVLLTSDFWRGRTSVEGRGRPLLLASLLADRALWGEKPSGYHLTNLILHAACAAALAWLAALLTGSAALAALAGLIFALHPVLTEAVCEVTFRADLLSALGVLLALATMRLACTRRSLIWAAASAAAFALGLLSKETAVVFPVLALLMEGLFPTVIRASRMRLTAAGLIAAVMVGYAAFRMPNAISAPTGRPAAPVEAVDPAPPPPARTSPRKPAPRPAQDETKGLRDAVAAPHPTTQFSGSPQEWRTAVRSRKTRILTMSGIFGDYVRLTLWPARLQADRSAPTVSTILSPRPWAGWIAMLAILAAAWVARTALPAASFGLCWFMIALGPVSGLVALPNLIAERYLYLAVAGAALAAAAALDAACRRLSSPRAALLAASAALLIPAAVATRRRIPAWHDDAALFGAPLVTESARLHYNRGLLAQKAGRLAEAEGEYRRAAEMNPQSVEALVNLAEVEKLLGHKNEQLTLLQRAVIVGPNAPIAYEALGAALEAEGKTPEALDVYEKGMKADPLWLSVRRHYTFALNHAGRTADALKSAKAAAELEPNSASARYEVGRIAQDAQWWGEAVAAFREAVRLDPKNELAWENLGVCVHDAQASVVPLGRAVELNPADADYRYNYGVALDDVGRDPEAEKELSEAVKLDPGYINAWHALGVVRQKLGDRPSAEEAYRRAVALAPDRVESLSNLAGLYEMDGRLDEAQALLEHAANADPRSSVLYNLANLYQLRSRFFDAAKVYEIGLEQDVRDGVLPTQLARWRVNLAVCELGMGRPELAESQALSVLAARPDYAPAQEVLKRAESALAAKKGTGP